MDGLSWEASQLVSSIQNSWSNHQQELQASFLMSCSNSGAFNSTQELHKVQTSQGCVNASRVNVIRQMVELSAAAATPNIASVVAERTLLQPQGGSAARLAADEILLEKSGTGTSWGEAFTSQSLPSLPTCMPHKGQQVLQVANGEVLAAAGSLDQSLDCLLSATNSNTGNSVEEDGISLILSDCRNLWSFGNYGSAVSSGESDSNAGNPRKEMPFPLNELDETAVSDQCSSDQLVNNSKQESKKPYSMKRSHDQVDPYFNILQNNNNTSNSTEDCFGLIADQNPPKSKKPRSEKRPSSSTNINFQQSSNTTTTSTTDQEPDPEAIAQMKEMIYRAAAFRPVNLGLEVVEKPKRKNVRISTDPQTVAARQRRERISERIRVLQRLVPGGSKMDTASMLDEAANYLKFLRSQVKALESLGQHKPDSLNSPPTSFAFSFNTSFPMQPHFPIQNSSHIHHHPQG